MICMVNETVSYDVVFRWYISEFIECIGEPVRSGVGVARGVERSVCGGQRSRGGRGGGYESENFGFFKSNVRCTTRGGGPKPIRTFMYDQGGGPPGDAKYA